MEYVHNGHLLASIKSWNSMEPSLRENYIGQCSKTNFKERIPARLYMAIKSDKTQNHTSELSYIRVIAERLGLDFAAICKQYMNDIYIIYHTSSNNHNICLLKRRKEPVRYGIYDAEKDDWVEYNGIKYDGNKGFYNHEGVSALSFEDNEKLKRFVVSIFSHNNNVDNTSFVCLLNTHDVSEAYFLTYDSWIKFKQDYDNKSISSMSDYKDIKEEGFFPKSTLKLSSIV